MLIYLLRKIMDTNILNQFLFASLVEKHARRKYEASNSVNVTKDDLKEAFDDLISLRLDVLDIAYNSEDLEAPNNVFEFKPKD